MKIRVHFTNGKTGDFTRKRNSSFEDYQQQSLNTLGAPLMLHFKESTVNFANVNYVEPLEERQP